MLAPLPAIQPLSGAAALGLLDAIGRIGLTLALPIFAPLLLAELAIALAGKYTQHINVMFLAMSAKQIVFVVLLPLYFTSLMFYMQVEMKELGDAYDTLRLFLGTPP